VRLNPKLESSLVFFVQLFFRGASSSLSAAFSIHTHHAFLQRIRLVLVLVLLGRRWRAAGLQHFLEHLIANTTHGVVLCDGNVSQLVVMAQVGGIGVPVLVCQPLAVGRGEEGEGVRRGHGGGKRRGGKNGLLVSQSGHTHTTARFIKCARTAYPTLKTIGGCYQAHLASTRSPSSSSIPLWPPLSLPACTYCLVRSGWPVPTYLFCKCSQLRLILKRSAACVG